ncbi:unnamed protein product [Paramecium sonneborni]|uniref:Uncharacterized protein n=1 Tax=Paramecium sonneborni TaxID=65129 RepID=A0A8S1M1P3_9CILI|nr:unnamed protein product [Paramecium sonneborni]
MSLIRCFTLYDCQKDQFYLVSGDKLFLTTKLNSIFLELNPKLNEIKVEPPLFFMFRSTLGCFICQYDPSKKYYFTLLSNPELGEEQQKKILNKISKHIQEMPNYNEISVEGIQNQKQKAIEYLIKDCENLLQKETKIIQDQVIDQDQVIFNSNSGNLFSSNQNIFQSQATLKHGFNTTKDFSSEILVRIFRCFMMYDYNRQFFFMFIRRGFPIDRTWSSERNKLEKEILKKVQDPDDPKAKPQEPPLSFKYKGEFGVYQAKYDKEAKCYFILLSRFGVKQDVQISLLSNLYDEIVKVKNYIKIKYDSLEQKIKRKIEQLINNYEQDVTKQVDQAFIDQQLFEKKYKKFEMDQIRVNQQQIKSPLLEEQNDDDMKEHLNKQQENALDEEDIVPWITELNDQNDRQQLYQSKSNLNNNNNNLKKLK